VAPLAKKLEKFHSAHHGHVPVEQDDVRHLGFAAREGFSPVSGFLDVEFKRFQDVARNLADHLGIIDDQTALHSLVSRFVRFNM
jgi:hypothetical protein